jgi:hypothetical protein
MESTPYIIWIMKVYKACDVILFATARYIGLTYHETVVWLWCVIWPLYTILITVCYFYVLGKLRATLSNIKRPQ